MKSIKDSILIVFLIIFQISNFNAQNRLEEAWTKLDSTDFFGAVEGFKKATKIKEISCEANLALAILYDKMDHDQEAIECFEKFLELSDNPMPIVHPLLYERFAINRENMQDDSRFELHNKLINDDRTKENMQISLLYNLGIKGAMQFDPGLLRKSIAQIQSIDTWSYVGPFDNVMNNGFSKNHGIVENPEKNATFTSKYGAKINWFTSELDNHEGFQGKSSKFNESQCLIYAQSFVKVDEEQDVIMKLGYTGSLRVWLNDQLVYSEPDQRKSGADEFQIKTTLKKGTNRVLVQLGDFDSHFANFMVRITDTNHDPIKALYSADFSKYDKSPIEFQSLPHYSIAFFEKKLEKKPSSLLYNWLLAKTYLRRGDENSAERYLKIAESSHPNNFLIVRELNILYSIMGNDTEQNKYYEKLKSLYPDAKEVLEEEINDYVNQTDKAKLVKAITKYRKLYKSDRSKIYCDLQMAIINEDYVTLIELIDKTYEITNRSNEGLIPKLEVAKAVGGAGAKRKLLETHLTDRYFYSKLTELAKDYLDDGLTEKAFKLMERALEVSNEKYIVYKDIANLHFSQKEYGKALSIYERLSNNRPTDYSMLNEIAILHNFNGDMDKAYKCYEKSLELYPFDFSRNEKMRETKGQKPLLSYIKTIDPKQVISIYENGEKREEVRDYDVLCSKTSLIINKYKAKAQVVEYILKITTENAIESLQRINFQPDKGMKINVMKAQTIKPDGNAINSEIHGNERVFTNLEVGDYLYVSFKETQAWGNKTSKFWSESFGFTSYQPYYDVVYELVTEGDISVNYELVHGNIENTKQKIDDVNYYKWSTNKPKIVSSENVSLEYGDMYPILHIALEHNWEDIVNWYDDLSSEQTKGDFTINKIIEDLNIQEHDNDREKAKKIYDFIVQNIQYSSIDFRQSGIIPQKASDVYHSRLGDCKDVSTLYTALAREAGLEANLVLINTSNLGYNSVVIPGINFNHCIVNVKINGIPTYLELTDPYLPFGVLDTYHYNAAILDINKYVTPEIKQVSFENQEPNRILRDVKIRITQDENLKINMNVHKFGISARNMTSTYLALNENDKKETLESSLSNNFKGNLKVENFDFSNLLQGSKNAEYSYVCEVSNELIKVGSFKSLKLPYSDLLVNNATFQAEERETPINYPMYETIDRYEEKIVFIAEGGKKFLEKPEDISLKYDGMTYEAKFLLNKDGTELTLDRFFEPVRRIIQPEEYKEFRQFMLDIHEAENIHLIFK